MAKVNSSFTISLWHDFFVFINAFINSWLNRICNGFFPATIRLVRHHTVVLCRKVHFLITLLDSNGILYYQNFYIPQVIHWSSAEMYANMSRQFYQFSHNRFLSQAINYTNILQQAFGIQFLFLSKKNSMNFFDYIEILVLH